MYGRKSWVNHKRNTVVVNNPGRRSVISVVLAHLTKWEKASFVANPTPRWERLRLIADKFPLFILNYKIPALVNWHGVRHTPVWSSSWRTKLYGNKSFSNKFRITLCIFSLCLFQDTMPYLVEKLIAQLHTDLIRTLYVRLIGISMSAFEWW